MHHLSHFASQVARILALAALVAIATVGSSAGAHAIDNGTLGIRPATESDFFHLTVAPGSSLDAVAIVNNYTTAPVTLLTYVVDGLTTAQGAFALRGQDDVPLSVGLWSTLTTTSITVPAESELAVPFTIHVPEGTTPGDYVGGLVIQEPLVVGDVSNTADGTAIRLDVIQRQGVRIYLNVAGETISKLDAGELSWVQSGDTVTVTLPVTNSGNTTLHPTGDVRFASGIGVNTTLPFVAPEDITPGTTLQLQAKMTEAAFLQIGQITVDVSSEAPPLSVSVPFVSIPWWTVAVVVVVIGAAGWLIRRLALFAQKARRAIAREEQQLAVLKRASTGSHG
jgi:hypothetical protein